MILIEFLTLNLARKLSGTRSVNWSLVLLSQKSSQTLDLEFSLSRTQSNIIFIINCIVKLVSKFIFKIYTHYVLSNKYSSLFWMILNTCQHYSTVLKYILKSVSLPIQKGAQLSLTLSFYYHLQNYKYISSC